MADFFFANQLLLFCVIVGFGHFELVYGVSKEEAGITNPEPVLVNAKLVIKAQENERQTSLWAAVLIIEALASIMVFMATIGQQAMVIAQGGLRKEGEEDPCDKSLALQISAAVIGTIFYLRMIDRAEDETRYREAMSYLAGFLFTVLGLIETVEYLNGFGLPDEGQEFRDGVENFSMHIYGILNGASPMSNNWEGDAARDYEKKNSYQQNLVRKDFAETDRDLAKIIEDQAAQVEFLRQGLAEVKIAIESLGFLLLGLQNLLSDFNVTDKYIIAFVKAWVGRVSTGALLAALGLVVDTVAKGFYDFAPRINKVKQAYQDVARDASVAASTPCPSRLAPFSRPASATSISAGCYVPAVLRAAAV